MMVSDSTNNFPRLVLASSSPFRAALLQRLGIPFTAQAPDVNESPLPNESPTALVQRLSQAKANTLRPNYDDALIIGSDQVASTNGILLGKPGETEAAKQQLSFVSGKRVDFLTGLCVLNARTGRRQVDHVIYSVHFRDLSEAQIDSYLEKEQALGCAASFRSERLGIALVRAMEGEDPTALV